MGVPVEPITDPGTIALIGSFVFVANETVVKQFETELLQTGTI